MAKSLEATFADVKDDVLTVAWHLLGDRAAAEDVLQDVFVSFARKRDRLAVNGSVRAYLVASAANRARDLLRRKKIEPEVRDAFPDRAGGEEGPAEAAARRDEAERVHRALLALPPEQRAVVVMKVHGRMTFREIAESSGTNPNTVQSRYRYALAALRERLAEKEREAAR